MDQLDSAHLSWAIYGSTYGQAGYDCGCFYDQVPPGTNPDGTAQGPGPRC